MISIHAPRVGCDLLTTVFSRLSALFQSTHPVRGATDAFANVMERVFDFNPRTPCGVRLAGHFFIPPEHNFNPRTPCGVRPAYLCKLYGIDPFQSTHPVRGATRCEYWQVVESSISIHAPRAGCDWCACFVSWCADQFQSTHPVRGAT